MAEQPDGKRLTRTLQQDRTEALKHIYGIYKQDMLALACCLCGSRDQAEDVLQDVFVNLARTDGLHIRGSLKAYLLACVANRVRTLQRGRCMRSLQETESPTDTRFDPQICLERSERQTRLQHALGRLPLEQREVIILHLQHGLRFRDIARSLGLSASTIRSRYRYGLEKLRRFVDGLEL